MKVTIRNGKIYIGTPIKYFGKNNIIVFGRDFYRDNTVNLKKYRGKFGDDEIAIVKGHAIFCESNKCTIGKWADFDKKYLDTVIDLLERADRIEEHYDDYFDEWSMDLWFGGWFFALKVYGNRVYLDNGITQVAIENFLEKGLRAFFDETVGDIGDYRIVSPYEIENKYFKIRYTSKRTYVRYNDGVSKYEVELDDIVPPSEIEKKLPKKLFDVPPEVANGIYVPDFRGRAEEIDALPTNGRLYRVNGRLAWYHDSKWWAAKHGDLIYSRDNEGFLGARCFGNTIVISRKTHPAELEKPDIPNAPAELIVYDADRKVAHYNNVDCGAFKCVFRWWNGKFIMSALPLKDGLYDAVTSDWREFLKDDPRKFRGDLRPLGVWVERDNVRLAADGYLIFRR